MAAKLDAAVRTVASLLSDNNSAIELYRANFATPQDLDGMRFWAQGEYNRIQSGFASTDSVVKLIARVLQDLISAIDEAEGGEGTAGPEGPAGPQGAQGPQGEQGVPGEDGQDGNAGDLIDDNNIYFDKTWSSQKIAQELSTKANTTDLHDQDHLLFGPDQTDVDTTTPITDMQILEYSPTGFVPDRRTKVHFSATQPVESDSLQGDIWVVT
jgi:hypothetical protein